MPFFYTWLGCTTSCRLTAGCLDKPNIYMNVWNFYQLSLTCPIGGAPIGGIMPGGIIPGGNGFIVGGRCPIGGIPMGGKWGGIPGGPI